MCSVVMCYNNTVVTGGAEAYHLSRNANMIADVITVLLNQSSIETYVNIVGIDVVWSLHTRYETQVNPALIICQKEKRDDNTDDVIPEGSPQITRWKWVVDLQQLMLAYLFLWTLWGMEHWMWGRLGDLIVKIWRSRGCYVVTTRSRDLHTSYSSEKRWSELACIILQYLGNSSTVTGSLTSSA